MKMNLKKYKEKKENKAKKDMTSIMLVAIFFIGLLILMYPTISDYWNSKVQSRAIMNYENKISQYTDEECDLMFAQARAYNDKLGKLPYPLVNYDTVEGYEDTMNIDNGIMGYITIRKIRVELPIYHGTSDSVLNHAAGHLQGSSIPVGGPGTHAVISAHRGLPSAKLFTDIDELEIGDTFVVNVLNKSLTYEVDQILIVEPDDISGLQMVEGKEYCTLLTCTPYGINTHRLLVRGIRNDRAGGKMLYVTPEAFKIDSLIMTPIVAAPMLLSLLILLIMRYSNKRKDVRKKSREEKINEILNG